MNEAVTRYMKEQQVRTKHQEMLLKLREKAVKVCFYLVFYT